MMVYGLTGSFVATGLATATAHLPDLLELGGLVSHRTMTHWPYIYLVPAALLWVTLNGTQPRVWQYCMLCMLVGCLAHLIEDFMSVGGIPLGSPYGGRLGLKLYVTNQATEYIAVLLMCTAFCALSIVRGFVSSEYLCAEYRRVAHLVGAIMGGAPW